ncbi:hypothetical protein K461DRAFT_96481 [Myriangium duriaei CBS 260.36]|uniref:Uncharacterized protein n=1 Tax=Myriangium duriaei CBS 260.36 TaxID=1168546 RepID=A0A9P4J6X2_9PEZI|nr:hypothetical protein K461DRAFT_96481 [Myriangium duriaei CBS 260.36]
MRILAAMPAAERRDIQTQLRRLDIPHRRLRHYWRTLSQFIGHRESFVNLAVEVMDVFGTYEDLFACLATVPTDEDTQTEIVDALTVLANVEETHPAVVPGVMVVIVAPAGTRRVLADAIGEAIMTGDREAMVNLIPGLMLPPGADEPDIENVMRNTNHENTARSIDWLVRTYPLDTIPHRVVALEEIETYLTTHNEWATVSEKSVLNKRRLGPNAATEYENAMRVLNGPAKPGDISGNLTENGKSGPRHEDIGLGDLVALIWHAINIYPDEAEKKHMRWAVFIAMSQCIDHDNQHRVCGAGFGNRLVRVLQGRYPFVRVDGEAPKVLPEQIISWAGKEFARWFQDEEREPTLMEIAHFCARLLADSENTYPYGSEEYNKVDQDLRVWMKYDYENARW